MQPYDKPVDERDPTPACRYCELAAPLPGETLFIFCRKHKQEISAACLCDSYVYDLLKRDPRQSLANAFSAMRVSLEPIDF